MLSLKLNLFFFLPVQVLPLNLYPRRQTHLKLPGVLSQRPLPQGLVWHSSTSEGQAERLPVRCDIIVSEKQSQQTKGRRRHLGSWSAGRRSCTQMGKHTCSCQLRSRTPRLDTHRETGHTRSHLQTRTFQHILC